MTSIAFRENENYDFPELYDFASFHRDCPDPAAADQAAAALGAALAHPRHGPRAVSVRGKAAPVLLPFLRALTAESPLRSLTLKGQGCYSVGFGTAELAALAGVIVSATSATNENRSACADLETLVLSNADLSIQG